MDRRSFRVHVPPGYAFARYATSVYLSAGGYRPGLIYIGLQAQTTVGIPLLVVRELACAVRTDVHLLAARQIS